MIVLNNNIVTIFYFSYYWHYWALSVYKKKNCQTVGTIKGQKQLLSKWSQGSR